MSEFTVTVFGGGSWGTTVAHMLSSRFKIRMWLRDPNVCMEINEKSQNSKYLSEFKLRPILASTDLEESLANTNLGILAVPASAARNTCRLIKQNWHASKPLPMFSLIKGFEAGSDLRITEVIKEELVNSEVGLLTGPNLSKEILQGNPASAVVAATSLGLNVRVQKMFTSNKFRVFTNPDLIGCELAGALKNVYVIAVGIAEGLGLGDNAKAAILTRGLAEMSELAVAMGGSAHTLAGLAGVGDLVASCSSEQSRNASVGRSLGEGYSLKKTLENLDQVAEGVTACKSVTRLAEKFGIYLPIAEHVESVCWGNASPLEATASLLEYRLGQE